MPETRPLYAWLCISLIAFSPLVVAQMPPAGVKTVDLSHKGLPEQSLRVGDALFKGRFEVEQQTGLITGELSISWDNGNRYSGQMRAGKRHGSGHFSWANGQTYDGDWQDDQATGKAIIVYANGDRYDGGVKEGLPEGEGVKVFASSGERYAGHWQAGQRQGKGRFDWANGQSFEGDWRQDQPEGRGTLIFANGDQYQGEVRAGLPQGQGVKTFAVSGDRYEGHFEQGLAQGEGRYLWPSGDVYAGYWQAGRKHGQGRYTWRNGDYWEGEFRDDQQEIGRLYFSPSLNLGQSGVDKLMQQARAASDSFSVRPGTNGTEKPVDLERLAAIPLVAAELERCSRAGLAVDCRSRMLEGMVAGTYFQHDWQSMFAEKNVSYEVDRRSLGEGGLVYSWFRFLDAGNGSARKTGIKYDCRSQALEIQLLYSCSAGGSACVLDRNFDKYVGRAIPAATIKGWFKGGCERRP